MKFLSWLIFIPFASVVVNFAVSNRQDVAVTFWPLPFDVDVPLYLLSLGTVAFGMIFAGFLCWFSVMRWRLSAGTRKRDAEAARKVADGLRERIRSLEADLAKRPAAPPSTSLTVSGDDKNAA